MGGTVSAVPTQNVIAIIWDFDKTLIMGDMQEPLFNHFNVDANEFWDEVDNLSDYYRRRGTIINQASAYLNHVLTYVKEGIFNDLTNQLLYDFGRELRMCPGIPDFFQDLLDRVENDPILSSRGLRIENYIISTGFAETIRGSLIAPYVEGIWGSEYISYVAPPGYRRAKLDSFLENISHRDHRVVQIGNAFDHTAKSRAIFEINKGVNKLPNLTINQKLPPQDRRIPFQNMLYIADGESDIPVFSIVKSNGGLTYGVYPPGNDKVHNQLQKLHADERIMEFGEADYRVGSQTYNWIMNAVTDISCRINV